jgi:glucuronokinase
MACLLNKCDAPALPACLCRPACRKLMQQVAELAEQGRQALVRRDWQQLQELMNDNFRLRRQLYGDAVIGKANLGMVQAAQAVGAAAKLTGSGGAVVALCCEGEQQVARLQQACRDQGFECVAVQVGPALHTEGTG